MNMFSKITEVMGSFKWIEKSTADFVREGSTKEIIGVRLRVTSAKEDRLQGAVTVYETMMKKMNWVAGDRVRIGVDLDGRRLAIQRCISGGYALSASPKPNASSRELIGESVNATAKFKVDETHDFSKLVSKSKVIPANKCIFETNTIIIDVTDAL